MRERGLDIGALYTGIAAGAVGGAADDGSPRTWVLCEDGRILGCTALLHPTASERRPHEEDLVLVGTFTHPDARRDRPGRFIAWWALDHAARLGGVAWVRWTTFSLRLASCYQAEQGWELKANVVPDHDRVGYVMRRRPERIPGLDALITTQTAKPTR